MGIDMTDLEMVKRCAEKMGYDQYQWQTGGIVTGSDLPISLPDGQIRYDPLHDDAQALALVKQFNLHIDQRPHPKRQITVQDCAFTVLVERRDDDINRAIVECVAKLP